MPSNPNACGVIQRHIGLGRDVERELVLNLYRLFGPDHPEDCPQNIRVDIALGYRQHFEKWDLGTPESGVNQNLR